MNLSDEFHHYRVAFGLRLVALSCLFGLGLVFVLAKFGLAIVATACLAALVSLTTSLDMLRRFDAISKPMGTALPRTASWMARATIVASLVFDGLLLIATALILGRLALRIEVLDGAARLTIELVAAHPSIAVLSPVLGLAHFGFGSMSFAKIAEMVDAKSAARAARVLGSAWLFCASVLLVTVAVVGAERFIALSALIVFVVGGVWTQRMHRHLGAQIPEGDFSTQLPSATVVS